MEHFMFGPKGVVGWVDFVTWFVISRISCDIVLEIAQLSLAIRSKIYW